MTLEEQLDRYRRARSALASADEGGVGFAGQADPEVLPAGVARIVTNDGDGEYTVTQQVWDEDLSEWRDEASEIGVVGCAAREVRARAGAAAGAMVRFWQERSDEGAVKTFIDAGGLAWAKVKQSGGSVGPEVQQESSGYWHWYVDCHPCDDKDASNVNTDVTLRLYIVGKYNGGPEWGWPNVFSGDVLAYVTDGKGQRMCVSEVMDAPLHTVRIWNDSEANIPRGWALCDGGTHYGQTAIDLRGRFVAGQGAGDFGGFRDTFGGAPLNTLALSGGNDLAAGSDYAGSPALADYAAGDPIYPPTCVLRFIERLA
jgi:hypothetical protein